MGTEDNIRELLSKGYSPTGIIQQGYKKSTVYKVYNKLTAETTPITPSQWWVTWQIGKQRYLPGEVVKLTYTIKNTSGMDLYIYRTGIQPEWLEGEWHAQEGRFLLHPGGSHTLPINIPIPSDLALGEYEMRWGLDAQFVGPGAPVPNPSIQTQWTEPFVLEVKRTLTGYKVFISHSTSDMYLVRQLEDSLDNEGITSVIAEDIMEPSIVLQEKFEALIRECQFFLALLTANGARSEWVIRETNYALSINKACVLLKERGTQIETGREWVEFSQYDPIETTMAKVKEALERVKQRHYGLAPPHALAPIAIGVLAFLFGLAAGRSKGSESRQ